MRNFGKSVVVSAMVVGMTASAAAQSYKPPIVGVIPPRVSVPSTVVATSSSYKPAFTRADAVAQVAAARAEAAAARAAAKASMAAARAGR